MRDGTDTFDFLAVLTCGSRRRLLNGREMVSEPIVSIVLVQCHTPGDVERVHGQVGVGADETTTVFIVDGQRIAGFSSAKKHVSYLPHSGQVLAALGDEDLAGFSASKGALKMPIDTPLPDDLVRKLIIARCAEAGVST